MRQFCLLSISALLAVAIALSGQAVSAEPVVSITRCDTVSVNGNLYPRHTFQVHNPATDAFDIACNVELSLQRGGDPADTCSFVQSSGPAGWSSHGTFWFVDSYEEEPCLGPGETLGGFQVVLTRAACCFDVTLTGAVPEAPVVGAVCFRCALETPTRARTWGRVKATYR